MTLPPDIQNALNDHCARFGHSTDEAITILLREAFNAKAPVETRRIDRIHDGEIPVVRTISEFLSIISNITSIDHRYYFRGESDGAPMEYEIQGNTSSPQVSTSLVPVLLRPSCKNLFSTYGVSTDDPGKLQKRLLNNLIRYSEQYRPDLSKYLTYDEYLPWLCLAQHHGLPTLLLDWTLNSLVALFFSVRNGRTNNDDRDGIIWMTTLKPSAKRTAFTVHLEQDEKACDEYENATRKKIRDNGVSEGSVIIVPRILTRRIETQAGRFILSPSRTPLNKLTDDIPWTSIVPIALIPGTTSGGPNYKQELRKNLASIRYHEGTMMATLDAYAGLLGSGFR